MERFVHLHNHTEYSLLDGGSRIKDLVAKAVQHESPALAITDHGAMYGAVDFYLACKDAGIKPIIGCEIYLARESMHKKDPRFDQRPHHLILLAKNEEGYRNLIKITSRAHLDGFYYKPRADLELLSEYGSGLIAMSACLAGEIPRLLQQGDNEGAQEAAKRYQEIFGKDDFYIELQYHENIEGQLETNARLVELAKEVGAPIVCTNDSHYVEEGDAAAHDILLCIQTGRQLDDPNRLRYPDDFSLKSPEQMAREFDEYPESLASTLEIAEKCDLELHFGAVRLPDYEVPAGQDNDSYLAEICRKGLAHKLGDVEPDTEKRLEYELGVISRIGYSQYFLIVHDFVRYATENGILTTCRGSAPGSLVTYALGITPINPIKYDVPFERFLNESRVTMPDIDMDFQDNRRDEVIDYIAEKYGSDRVAQIITFGTLLARNAVRDVGRVLGVNYGDVDRIAKMIPQGVSLEQAKKDVPQLRDEIAADTQIARLIETAMKIEGLPRHASTHAAGVVISSDPLTELVPLQQATKGHGTMTQFHMKNIAQLGLLKFDILGLANLAIIQDAVSHIEEHTGEKIDINRIPLDDKKTFELLSSGETTGIFQFESPGMRKYLTELKPSELEDLMAMVALYRPGPMANIPSYIRRKHGQEKVECLHPAMEKVLQKTYGVMVYQEDIMAVAQAMAGYSPTEADSLCAAVRKKKARQLSKHRTTFVEGAKGKGIPAETVDSAFDLFEPFARYGFCKGHAACYGLVAYQTAYLKANYTPEYMAAVLTHEMSNHDKIAASVAESRRLGLRVLPPDVNRSDVGFTSVKDEGAIRFGLAAVKNLGTGAAERIVGARGENGGFKTLYDFCVAVGPGAVNKDALASLIKAGAFDSVEPDRARLVASVDPTLKQAASILSARRRGQSALFGSDQSDRLGMQSGSEGLVTNLERYTTEQIIAMERELLGVPVTHDPFAQLTDRLDKLVGNKAQELTDLPPGEKVRMGGVVSGWRDFQAKNGPMAFVTVHDSSGPFEVLMFSDALTRCAKHLRKDATVVVEGKVSHRDRAVGNETRSEAKVICDKLYPLEMEAVDEQPVAERIAQEYRTFSIRIPTQGCGPDILEHLSGIFERYSGTCPVTMVFPTGEGEKRVALGERFCVDPRSKELLRSIETLLGPGTARAE